MNTKQLLDQIAEAGEMIGFTENGEVVTVQELLSKLRGRDVSFYEATAYVLRKRKVNPNKTKIENFIKYAKQKHVRLSR